MSKTRNPFYHPDNVSPYTVNIDKVVNSLTRMNVGTKESDIEDCHGPELLSGVKYHKYPYKKLHAKAKNPWSHYKRKGINWVWGPTAFIDCSLIKQVKIELSMRENGATFARALLLLHKKDYVTIAEWQNPWVFVTTYDLDAETDILEVEDAWRDHKFMTKLSKDVKMSDYQAFNVFRSMRVREREHD